MLEELTKLYDRYVDEYREPDVPPWAIRLVLQDDEI